MLGWPPLAVDLWISDFLLDAGRRLPSGHRPVLCPRQAGEGHWVGNKLALVLASLGIVLQSE